MSSIDRRSRSAGFAIQAAGARILCGGERVTEGEYAKGAFVAPTIFSDCSDDMSIVREEIFGPVMSILSFQDEAEVIRRANDTPYGLAAGVFTRDLSRAHGVVSGECERASFR